MKVIIEVPKKFFEFAKGMMLCADINAEMAEDVNQAMNMIYKAEQPLQVKMERLLEGEVDARQSYSQIMLAIATMTIGQFGILDKELERKSEENIILEDRIARLQEKLRDFGCEL